MKSHNILPSDNERVLAPNECIISTADPRGVITSVNDVLVKYSGYSRDELVHAQHNIVRHPDMPRAIFWLTWDALTAGEDFTCFVKNLCKDGGYYWVFAHILPEWNSHGEISGYRSVRRAPRPGAVRVIAELYAQMLAAERAAPVKEAIGAGLAVLCAYLNERGTSYEKLIASL